MSAYAVDHLVVRVDADERIGLGHLMRCVALTQAWRSKGGGATLLLGEGAPPLEVCLERRGIQVERLSGERGSQADASGTIRCAERTGASWVVLDGYHFQQDYQRTMQRAGLQTLVIDDMGHGEHYYADIILNQNLHAATDLYARREADTRLLLGPRYALLREEFLRWQGWRRSIPEVARRILVTCGGGGVGAVTLKVIRALDALDLTELEVTIAGQVSEDERMALRDAARHACRAIRFEPGAGREINMAALMAWADVAVSAGGSTCWELAFMGLPSLIVVLADNQRLVAERLAAAGAAVNLGWCADVTPEGMTREAVGLLTSARRRAELSRRGSALVDGSGAERVAQCLVTAEVRLREARAEDCGLLWRWANEPEIRTASFSSTPIPWASHAQWFERKMRDPACRLFIAEDPQGTPIGQVRCDISGRDAVLSVSVGRQHRGRGYGRAAIRLACQRLFGSVAVTTIRAYVKPDNAVSLQVFRHAGFQDVGATVVDGHDAFQLVRSRADGVV